MLEIQSQAVWSKYSEIDLTPANRYFANLAATNGTEIPLLPIDAGQLAIGATSALTLLGTNDFTPAPGGRGGQADIQHQYPGARLGPGGAGRHRRLHRSRCRPDQRSRRRKHPNRRYPQRRKRWINSNNADGDVIIIDTDAVHPLSAPDLLVVANPSVSTTPSNNFVTVDNRLSPYYAPYFFAAQIPTAATGTGQISILPGSVVEAKGEVSSTQPASLHLGTTVAPMP